MNRAASDIGHARLQRFGVFAIGGRRLTAAAVLVFSFALVSYSSMATGQDKDTPKSKSTSKSTAKSTKKGKSGDAPKSEKTEK